MAADINVTNRLKVPPEFATQRLDVAAGILFPEYSRSRLQSWIKSGELTVNGKLKRPKDKLSGGEWLNLEAELQILEDQPQSMALDIVYEDESILVINKPVGLVVHPGAGNRDLTLMNGLLGYCDDLGVLPRAGIVHRLDKDTSGLMVVAKTLVARDLLVRQLSERTMGRDYQAVVYGNLQTPGVVDQPIGRHSVHRTRMAVVSRGKEAITRYRPRQQFPSHTLVELSLATGRTHQIRVHMQHLGHPLVGDPVYGGTFRKPKHGEKCSNEDFQNLVDILKGFSRQALHAGRLSLVHPATGEAMSWMVELPEDMSSLLKALAVASAKG